jgi:hypothetical protein
VIPLPLAASRSLESFSEREAASGEKNQKTKSPRRLGWGPAKRKRVSVF